MQVAPYRHASLALMIGLLMKHLFLLLILFGLATGSHAQTVIVQSATEQGWANGACCGGGVAYNIVLRISIAARDFSIDSIWMHGQLWEGIAGKSPSIVITHDSDGQTCTIHKTVSWRHHGMDIPDPSLEITKPLRMPHFEGDALIVYHAAGEQHRLVLPKMDVLHPIPYP
jgi:hypothetical protein